MGGKGKVPECLWERWTFEGAEAKGEEVERSTREGEGGGDEEVGPRREEGIGCTTRIRRAQRVAHVKCDAPGGGRGGEMRGVKCSVVESSEV